MANAAAGTKVQSATTPWGDDKIRRPCEAGSTNATTYVTGEMIGLNANGNAVHCDDTAGVVFDGIMADSRDITVDSADLAGDKHLYVERPFRFMMYIASTSYPLLTDVGKKVYALYDNQVAYSGTANAIFIGYVDEVIDATTVSIRPAYGSVLSSATFNGQTLTFTGTTGNNVIVIPAAEASALTITVGSANYFQIVTTAGSELTQVLGVAATAVTNTGGGVQVTGGIGGATSGAGGTVVIAGGAGTAGNSAGGLVSLTGGAGQGSAAGGAASLVGGVGGATGAGGVVTITGGAGGATGAGGAGAAVNVTGGAGGAGTAAVGGATTITGGAGAGTSAGGAAGLIGGTGGATGAGGAVSVTGGAGGVTSGTGGAATVTGGAGTGTNAIGGAAALIGGLGMGTQAGGAIAITSGAAGATGVAGAVNISVGGATAGNGSAVTITGGAGAGGTNAGGNVNLVGGAAVSTGIPGEVQVNGVGGLGEVNWQQFLAANVPVSGTSYPVYLANRAMRVKAVRVVCSSTATVPTVDVIKDTGTTAPGGGTSVLTGAISFNTTANTVVAGTLTSTIATLTLAAGDRLSLKWGGTVGSLTGALVNILLEPC
jgi:hypothetical protein